MSRVPAVLLILCCLTGVSQAQQEPYVPRPVPETVGPPVKFWDTGAGERVQLVTNLVLARNPYVIAGLRQWASEYALLPEWQYVTDVAVSLPGQYLDLVKDGTPLPDFSGKNPPSASDWAFYAMLNRAILLADDTPQENFKRSAEDYMDVQFPQIFGDPERYRGKVVRVRGRLLALRKSPAPRIAENEGVRFVYEGWIKGPVRHTNPVCVIVTELPEGLRPTETELDREVTFYGYFLKKFEYQAANAKRLTLYFVGRTLEIAPPSPPATYQPFSRFVLFAVAGGALALTAAIAGLGWWFRRGDARVRSRLTKLREMHGLDFEDPEPPLATPVAPPPAPTQQNGTTEEHSERRPKDNA
jgi:hypothetical protein